METVEASGLLDLVPLLQATAASLHVVAVTAIRLFHVFCLHESYVPSNINTTNKITQLRTTTILYCNMFGFQPRQTEPQTEWLKHTSLVMLSLSNYSIKIVDTTLT
ncbi:unnamed protein product [Polarella glacialis]|uniref:Uncharacterized protein n=1 Tax=Polarella glacialis TaxID=89957 RepID=A0A813IT33_POLGL|nr:unnamed protein product [Polarella glacialis]CAE8683046.1 unnamed protein product [Polarella glacialis]